MITTRRVYNDGSMRTFEYATIIEASASIAYSQACRPGCALFLGHKCKQMGYLGPQRCSAIIKSILAGQEPDPNIGKQGLTFATR